MIVNYRCLEPFGSSLSLAAFTGLKGIDHLDTAVIDEDLIGGALVEEADGDQHISSMTTFELAQVRTALVQTMGHELITVLPGCCHQHH